MDRFLVKPDEGDLGAAGEEPVPSGGASGGQPSPRWRHLRAQGLNCDYTVLFGKAEADEIFRELEQAVEYFTGNISSTGTSSGLVTTLLSWVTARDVQGSEMRVVPSQRTRSGFPAAPVTPAQLQGSHASSLRTKMVVTTSGNTETTKESWPPGVPSRLSPLGPAETSSSGTKTLEGRGPSRQWRRSGCSWPMEAY